MLHLRENQFIDPALHSRGVALVIPPPRNKSSQFENSTAGVTMSSLCTLGWPVAVTS